ncbi:hypothetical protein [Paraburkholderia sp.]|uniref:hypothetical protein n=1 Tax=Paraburkholderia sp. TaxID=1926495 RepID=UPI003C7C02CE
MNADPREQFGWRNVGSCGIGFDIGYYRSFVNRRVIAGIALYRGGLKRKQAKHFDSMPGDWRATCDIVADRSRATAQFSGDFSDGNAAGQVQKLMQTAVSLLCEHLITL